ncbi:MAG: M23 family metallopeptidase [Novosphingobium sp.]|nr:M23 family metallopeptidase [Novosphingobium sp.]
MRRHWFAAVLAMATLAACSSGAAESTAAAQPATAPLPSATPAAAPKPVGPPDFVIAGEFTQGGWVKGTAPAGTVALTLDGAQVPVAGDGSFFIAFDRDSGQSGLLVARLGDGKQVRRQLAIAPRAWKIEHVNVARRPGGATEAFMRIRRPELAQINAARSLDTGSEGWRQRFIWPVKGRLSGLFGSQRIYRGEPASYHSGTDITTGRSGTPFVAPADGVVILAADHPFTLEGNLLMIDHGMGLNSAFLHCSEILVKQGDHVRQGQVIGRIGMTGRATGPHLHWGLKWRQARLDPILFTGPMN